MIRQAAIGASAILVGLLFFAMDQCRFLIPYRDFIIAHHGTTIAAFGAALYINVFAALYSIGRKLFLKDTGRKLAHLERQLRSGGLSEELARRLED